MWLAHVERRCQREWFYHTFVRWESASFWSMKCFKMPSFISISENSLESGKLNEDNRGTFLVHSYFIRLTIFCFLRILFESIILVIFKKNYFILAYWIKKFHLVIPKYFSFLPLHSRSGSLWRFSSPDLTV
jgi:hypothetical protein